MNALRGFGAQAAHGRNALSEMATLIQRVGAENSRGGQDTILAHITPQEASILHALGGSGRTDAVTGAVHFDDSDSPGGETNGVAGGERDTPGSGSSTSAYGGGNLGSNDAYGLDGFLADPVGMLSDSLPSTQPIREPWA